MQQISFLGELDLLFIIVYEIQMKSVWVPLFVSLVSISPVSYSDELCVTGLSKFISYFTGTTKERSDQIQVDLETIRKRIAKELNSAEQKEFLKFFEIVRVSVPHLAFFERVIISRFVDVPSSFRNSSYTLSVP